MGAETIVAAVPMEEREIKVPSVVRCGLMLFAARIALKIRGFSWTIRWIRRRLDATPMIGPAASAGVTATEYAVAMAGALYPGRAKCLEQSIVLFYVLRRAGVPAQFRMGVQPYPFLAHAWVEYLGHPLNDVAEHVKRFALLPDGLQ